MKKQFKLNTKLLIETLSQQSITGKDENIRKYIFDKLETIKDVTVSEDKYGNIMATKGISNLYPCVCCHYDTVHSIIKDKKVKQERDLLYAFSYSNKSQTGIGGDDMLGVALCLQLLSEVDIIKACFMRDEESGCRGAKAFDLSFFNDCKYAIEIDRQGNDDFSISMGSVEVNTTEFQTDCSIHLNNYNYKLSYTSITDVYTFKLRGLNICVTNVSCGYYNPHTDYETVSITDANNCYCLVYDIICNLPNKKYVHEYKPPVYVPINRSNQQQFSYPLNKEIRYNDMYLDIEVSADDADGYYIYNGKELSQRITGRYSYYHKINSIYDKEQKIFYNIDKIDTYSTTDKNKINMLLKHLTVVDKGYEFVYSLSYGRWVLKAKAQLYEALNGTWQTYITQSTYKRWEKGF